LINNIEVVHVLVLTIEWWKVVYVFKLDASSLSTNRWLWAVILLAIN